MSGKQGNLDVPKDNAVNNTESKMNVGVGPEMWLQWMIAVPLGDDCNIAT